MVLLNFSLFVKQNISITSVLFALLLLYACEGGSDKGLISCSKPSDCAEGMTCDSEGRCVDDASGDNSDGDTETDTEAPSEIEVEGTESQEADIAADGDNDDAEPDEEIESEADDENLEVESESEADERYEYSIKCINMPMADVISVLPEFAERNLVLYLNVTDSSINDPDFAELLRQSKNKGVGVKLWPLLKPEEGAWCNEDNVDEFIKNVYDILDHVQTLEHNIETVVINSELGPPKIDLIRQYFSEGNLVELYKLLKSNVDRKKFAESQEKIRALVDALHVRGFDAQITTYPYLLDDLTDSDSDIQDAANVVLEGVEWDRLAFTPYSAAYTDDFNKPFGPYFVYSYAQMAKEKYGRRADIALGLIAPGGTHTYENPHELAADVAAAKAAGIHRIDVFDLAGMLKDNRFDEWADALLAEPEVPPVEETTEDFHHDFQLADSLLDGVNEKQFSGVSK